MHCYCLSEMLGGNIEFQDIEFYDFENEINEKWCDQWLKSYATQQAILVGAPIVINIINVICKIVFEAISAFGKEYTKNAETMSTFRKITILQFSNLAVLTLLINFRAEMPFFNSIGILNGTYENFTREWYRKIGSQYALAMFIAIFTPISEIIPAWIAFVKRYFDRNKKPKYTIEGTDNIETKKVL